MLNTPCPICNQLRNTLERYPHKVCNNCINTGTFADDLQTIPISFENINLGGGFQSIVNGVIGNQRRCYIKGYLCFATEARFGGIIISSYENKNENENLS